MAKTRLQLDAELNRGNKVYSGPADVFRRTWKNEGIRGIQRGLAPAVSCRLHVYHVTQESDSYYSRSMLIRFLPASSPSTLSNDSHLLTENRYYSMAHALVRCTLYTAFGILLSSSYP